jgi:hypothetical protein
VWSATAELKAPTRVGSSDLLGKDVVISPQNSPHRIGLCASVVKIKPHNRKERKDRKRQSFGLPNDKSSATADSRHEPRQRNGQPTAVGSGDLLGSVVMAMLPVPNKSETRQCPKYNCGNDRPPKISGVKIARCGWHGCNNAGCRICNKYCESSTDAADNCCDDGWDFCFHNFVMCANAA